VHWPLVHLEPAGHAAQLVQAAVVAVPSDEKKLGWHEHVTEPARATLLVGHAVHEDEPDEDANVLAGQSVHRPPAHCLPAGQREHAEQEAAPATLVNVLAAQLVHRPPAQEEPNGHDAQLVQAALVARPVAEKALELHAHVVLPAMLPLNAGHGVHAADAAVWLKVLAGHTTTTTTHPQGGP
jgi:hypothetical protein